MTSCLPTTVTCLLQLASMPNEVLAKIFSELLVADGPIIPIRQIHHHWPDSPLSIPMDAGLSPSLLATCKHFRAAGASLLYSHDIFYLRFPAQTSAILRTWSKTIGIDNASRIKTLRFGAMRESYGFLYSDHGPPYTRNCDLVKSADRYFDVLDGFGYLIPRYLVHFPRLEIFEVLSHHDQIRMSAEACHTIFDFNQGRSLSKIRVGLYRIEDVVVERYLVVDVQARLVKTSWGSYKVPKSNKENIYTFEAADKATLPAKLLSIDSFRGRLAKRQAGTDGY